MRERKRTSVRVRFAASKNKPCMDCGQTFPPICMDYDHRDPETKVADVSKLALTASWEDVEAEIAKCDLVCANCHRIRTQHRYKYRG